jgi:hypothetical protein
MLFFAVASEVADSFILPIFNCSPNFNTTNIKKYYLSRTDCYSAAAFLKIIDALWIKTEIV